MFPRSFINAWKIYRIPIDVYKRQEVIFPTLRTADQILVAAHGNSLRGIIKYLKNISDEEIVHLNLPTAVPYVFEFDDDLKLVNDYFLGDPEEIKKLMEAVANQGKKK